MGSPTGALQGQAEDWIAQRKLSEPGAVQTCAKAWLEQARSGRLRTGSGEGQGYD